MPLLILIPVGGLIVGWRRVVGGSAGSATIHAVAMMILVMYAAALVGLLREATLLLMAVGTISLVDYVSRLWRRKESVRDDLPIIVLLVLAVLTWICHRGGFLLFYDEYSHWGIFLREMVYLDGFWGGDTSAIHPRYPPGATLWQYFFVRFTDDRDSVAYLAQSVLLFAPLAVLWQSITLRRWPWVFAIAALVLLGIANFGHGIASLYVDHVLAAWFAGIVLNFAADRAERPALALSCYALPIATLALIKGSGLLLALAAASIIGVLLVAMPGRLRVIGRRQTKLGVRSVVAATWLLLPLAVTVSWTANRDALDVPPERYSTPSVIAGLYQGDSVLSKDQEDELSRRFTEVVVEQQLSKNQLLRTYEEFSYPIMGLFTDEFRLTTLTFLIIWIVWQIVVLQWFTEQGDRLPWFLIGLGVFVTAVVYLGTLYLSYRFAFGDDGLRLPSYLRYAHTVILPLVLIGFAPLMPAFRHIGRASTDHLGRPVGKHATILFVVSLAAFYIAEPPYLGHLYRPNGILAFRQVTAPLAERVHKIVGPARIWIYLPVEDPNALLDKILRYQLSPAKVEIEARADFLDGDRQTLMNAWQAHDYLWFPLEDPEADRKLQRHLGSGLGDRLIRVRRTDDGTVLEPLSGSLGSTVPDR